MNTQDFDLLGKHVYENLEQINHILSKAKFVTKLGLNDANVDLPGMLLALTKEDAQRAVEEGNELEQPERPSEEEIDALFETIRTPSTAPSKAPQRQGSFKKIAGIPLQQSRILNETNLVANATMMTGSSSDLTGIANKSTTHPKQPPVDVEALVDRFREAIDSLTKIENQSIESVRLSQIRRRYQQEWASTEKICRHIASLLDECKQELDCNQDKIKQEPLISNELIKSMKKLQTNFHYTAYIKKTENLPDLSKTLGNETFPLSECLESIGETIRQKQL